MASGSAWRASLADSEYSGGIVSRRRRPDVQAFGTIIVCREETHPDEIELLELVANGRLPFVRDAATHAGR